MAEQQDSACAELPISSRFWVYKCDSDDSSPVFDPDVMNYVILGSYPKDPSQSFVQGYIEFKAVVTKPIICAPDADWTPLEGDTSVFKLYMKELFNDIYELDFAPSRP